MATIKEIAAEAGVSVMTVSNVINQNRARVSPATEARVREILEKHHYVRNMAARALSSKSSRIVGLLLPIWYEDSASMLLDPYAGQLVGYLEEFLRARQYYPMILSFKNSDQVLTLRKTWQIDGMILVMPHNDEVTHDLIEKSSFPLVVLDRFYEDSDMLSVGIDDRRGGYLATRHLLGLGHRRIGFAGPSIFESSVIQDRYQGCLDALREANLQFNPAWLFDGMFHQAGGEEIGRRILEMADAPTAVIASEDLIACGIIRSLQEQGYSVPEKLSVIGFDDSLPSRLISPALTTVGQDIRLKAQTAASMLFRAMEKPDYRKDRRVLEVQLIKRDSVRKID